MYQFITEDADFEEAHMGLYDSQIEAAILYKCFTLGAEQEHDYKVIKVLPRPQEKPFTVKINGQIIYQGAYVKKYARNLGCYDITLNVWEGNECAQRFYNKLGMRVKETNMEFIL